MTALRVQKNNKERISLFCKDDFLIGLHQSTLLQYGIKKGTEITRELFNELQEAENRKEIENYLLNLLSRRTHARSELKTKAVRKGYPADTVQELLQKFEENDWINDEEFAQSFVHDKFKLQRWGPVKIQSKLRSMGISKGIIERALQGIEENIDDFQVLKQLVVKRKAHFLREQDLQKRKRKVANYLLRKGFSSDTVFNCLEQLLKELEK